MKKFLSALLAVLLAVTFCISAFAEEQPAEEATETWPENAKPAMDMSLEEYAKTHNLSEEPILEDIAAQEPYSPFVEDRSVFGSDDRRIISDRSKYPYSAIARMNVHFRCGCGSQGTGFMVNETFLMTASHMLVCADHHKTADNITIYFGFKNSGDYFYKYDGDLTYWYGTDFPDGKKFEWDYGYVKFKEAVGERTGWFGVCAAPDSWFEGKTFNLTGYVGDDLYDARGKVEIWNEYVLNHQIDAVPGTSGCPVYTDDYLAVAIEAGENSQTNFARRITSAILNDIGDIGLY